jgi:ribonucleoside-triphosphate reductase
MSSGVGKKMLYILRVIKHQETGITKIEEIDYKGVIWSVNTENETVIAKRKGKVFITGNTPFLNVSLDVKIPAFLKNQPVIIGGEAQRETYGEFQKEVDIFNKAFYECLMEGDSKGRVFTFPIPTISITKDFDWDNESLVPMWEATAKYGVNYFSNFVNSDMNPEDFRSMCCRLRLSNKELIKRGGGLFGSQPLTGSIGVCTINLPRIGYLSKNKDEFYNRLGAVMDLAKESLEIKRKAVDNFIEKGLYPYSKHYLSSVKKMRGSYFGNHFSTIGLIGMNEALLNFIGEGTGSEEGRKLAAEILDFMRNRLIEYQEKTGNLYNLEATPGEGAAYRQASIDKKRYPDIITAGTKDAPYYTNSVHLPVGYTDDPFEALDLQDELQQKFTGGTVLHLFLGERLASAEGAKNLVKKVLNNYHLPYITITPTFSVCPNCGYLKGEQYYCPNCKIKGPKKIIKNI